MISMRSAFKVAAVAVVGVALISAAYRWWPLLSPITTTTETSTTSSEVPVSMPTDGLPLWVSSIQGIERFSRSTNKSLLGFSFGTTTTQVQVAATYRYHMSLAKPLPLRRVGDAVIVSAPDIEPDLPVAFDTSTVIRWSENGWARFDKVDQLQGLEREITAGLAQRARSASYMEMARGAGRRTVAKFVKTWALKQPWWEPRVKVIVLYPGESLESRRGDDSL